MVRAMAEASNLVNEGGRGLEFEISDACVFYKPGSVPSKFPQSKKRKVHDRREDAIRSPYGAELPKLLDGRESAEFVEARVDAFSHLWAVKLAEIQRVLDEVNADIIQQIFDFVTTIEIDRSSQQLPAGLVNAGLASTATGSLYDSVLKTVQQRQDHVFFQVHAAECHSLKAALKAIIHQGAAHMDVDSENEEAPAIRENRRLLNYDLQALHKYVRAHNVSRCTIYFQNSEALDPQVLGEIVDVLLSWNDRIPFVLLFEMAMSAELFQEKLSRSTVRQLRGALFQCKPAIEILDILFSAAMNNGSTLWVGPQVSRMLLDRQTEHIASVKSFISALKYCYMMHFYQNPLSFLCYERSEHTLQKEHVVQLKKLPSFNRYLEVLTSEDNGEEATRLVRDNKHLLTRIRAMLDSSLATLKNLHNALSLLLIVNEFTSLRSNLTFSSLYIKALAGELVDSTIVRELISSVRKLPSNRMLELLLRLRRCPVLSTAEIEEIVTSLRFQATKERSPVRSTYDEGHNTVRTVVKGQKVILDKGKKTPDPPVAEYTKLVERVDLILISCMAKTIAAPRDICFNEILIFDGKSSLRDILGSAPRTALERALSRPHDYLACRCCDVMEGQLAASQPATALVYQLYLESGTSINIQDLWLAFRAIVDNGSTEEDLAGEDEMLAIFHRALAELRYLGMLKNNRRKADHLAKVRWKGL